MKMRFLKSVMIAAVFALFATSCEKNEGGDIMHDNYIEQEYTGCFSVINKKGADKYSILQGTTYKFRWRYDYTADIYIYNAKFSAMMPDGVNIDIEGLKWYYDGEVKVISAKDVVPTKVTMNGNSMNDMSSYVLNELNVEVFERRLFNFEAEYLPVISVSMRKGDVEVSAVREEEVYFGNTSVINAGNSSQFLTNKPIYKVSLNPETMLANIKIFQAQFADRMPPMDMEFNNIPFEIAQNGYKFATDELIPMIKGIPFPDYKVTNLSGQATAMTAKAISNTGLDLRFNCMDIYAVTSRLGYPIPTEWK